MIPNAGHRLIASSIDTVAIILFLMFLQGCLEGVLP